MELFQLPVRWGGLGILDPTKAAQSSYELSFSAISMVREAILGDEPLDVPGQCLLCWPAAEAQGGGGGGAQG